MRTHLTTLQAAGPELTAKPEFASVFSNRSASFLKLNKVTQSLADAETCVLLRPDWEKSHFRKALALEEKGDDAEALLAYQAALATTTGSGNPEIGLKIKRLAKKKNSKPVPFHFPKTKPPPKAKGGNTGAGVGVGGVSSQTLVAPCPVGELKWLTCVTSPREPVATRVAAANAVGGWLAEHLDTHLKKTPGESEWFFENRSVVAFLDKGLFDVVLDTVTHTVVSIINFEQRDTDGNPDAASDAAASADLAGALTGVLHNLLHPSLRAWQTRKQHHALLGAFEQVLRMEGSPLNDEKGTPVRVDDATKQFTALSAKILTNQGALQVLCGHDALARARLQLLRSLTQRDRSEGDTEDVNNRVQESARALVVLKRCRYANGGNSNDGDTTNNDADEKGIPSPAWEPVLDALLTDAGADEVRDEVRKTIEQHALLAGAFLKFGFEGSVGI
jgi:hypothetical protein